MADRPESSDRTCVLVAGARTPMGRLLGGLKDFSAAELGGFAIRGALSRPGSPGGRRVRDHGAGAHRGRGPDPRPSGRGEGGHPDDRPRAHVNKVCLSGIDAIALADQLIRAGEFDIVVAGGQESMTSAPHLLPRLPAGLQVRRRHAASTTWRSTACGTRSPTRRWGAHRGRQRVGPAFAARSRTPTPPAPTSRGAALEERAVRRRDRPGGDPAAQGRAADVRATTRASGPTRPSRPSPGCGPHSVPTAPSRRAPPRRSPTAPPRWSS